MNTVQFGIGAFFIVLGLLTEAFAVFGIFRFSFCLNRMHSAAIGDTLGMGLVALGLCVISGLSVTTLKLFLVFLCFWSAGPVSSHLLARLEITTNDKIDQYAPERNLKNEGENK